MRKAFEYSVDRIGQAAGAGPLWQDYLALLQQPRPGSAAYNALFGGGVAGQEDANRTAVLRWEPYTLTTLVLKSVLCEVIEEPIKRLA